MATLVLQPTDQLKSYCVICCCVRVMRKLFCNHQLCAECIGKKRKVWDAAFLNYDYSCLGRFLCSIELRYKAVTTYKLCIFWLVCAELCIVPGPAAYIAKKHTASTPFFVYKFTILKQTKAVYLVSKFNLLCFSHFYGIWKLTKYLQVYQLQGWLSDGF